MPPLNVPFEKSAATEGQQHKEKKMLVMKKQKKKKSSFSLDGLVSDHHHNTLDQLNQVDTLLPASPVEFAVAIPQDTGDCIYMKQMYMILRMMTIICAIMLVLLRLEEILKKNLPKTTG